jgi:hypothetical protein
VTTPSDPGCVDTEAIVASDELQFISEVSSAVLPSPSLPCATRCALIPTATIGAFGLIESWVIVWPGVVGCPWQPDPRIIVVETASAPKAAKNRLEMSMGDI